MYILEVLEIDRQADIHGVAIAIDELRLGQQQMDEADVPEIVGQFVDRALGFGRHQVEMGEILLRHGMSRRRRQVLQTLGKIATVGHIGKSCPVLVKMRQFISRLHLGVARQDTLDQGGSRARHADDENRFGRRGAQTGVAREHITGEIGFDSLNLRAQPHPVISD